MSNSGPNLLIIGASTRSAGFSALRAGFKPICLDMFADADLQANAVVRQVENYPSGLIDALQALPRLPLLYVGGLENNPEILNVAAEFHDLMGNGAKQVEAARSADLLAEAMRISQVETPEWKSSSEPPETDGTWLLRPIFGCGGRGITRWTEEAKTSPTLNEPHIFQKHISGTVYSGVYIAQEVGDVRFVGLTQQLIGSKESNAAEFQWSGNFGPVALPIEIEHKMRRAGNVLKWKAGLKGLFGIDFIVTEENRIFVTEVNPRYPASLELLEFATGQPLLPSHIECFAELNTENTWTPDTDGPLFGKAILYSPRNFQLTIDLTPEIKAFSKFPDLADIPQAGTQFKTGEPICTIFATGQSAQDCREKLTQQLQELQSRIIPASNAE